MDCFCVADPSNILACFFVERFEWRAFQSSLYVCFLGQKDRTLEQALGLDLLTIGRGCLGGGGWGRGCQVAGGCRLRDGDGELEMPRWRWQSGDGKKVEMIRWRSR